MTKKIISKLQPQRFALALVLGLTLFSGIVHGYLDGRWSKKPELKQMGQRLEELPDQIGDWILDESSQLDAAAAALLQCHGSIVRVYRNQQTDDRVNVALLFGPRGPIAVHTPEVCYSSVGTNQVGETKQETISTATQQHHLWSVQFAQAPNPEASLDVWYAWSDGGSWEAANYPRIWMTENLYKIQVAGPVGESNRPCEDFLESFLPQVSRVIGSMESE